MNKTISELDQELEHRTEQIAPALLELPGCGAITAAKLLAEIGPVDRFKVTPSSPATAASHPYKQARLDIGATLAQPTEISPGHSYSDCGHATERGSAFPLLLEPGSQRTVA